MAVLARSAKSTAAGSRRRGGENSRVDSVKKRFFRLEEIEDAGCSSGFSSIRECVRVNTGEVSSRPARGVFDEGKTRAWGTPFSQLSQRDRSYP